MDSPGIKLKPIMVDLSWPWCMGMNDWMVGVKHNNTSVGWLFVAKTEWRDSDVTMVVPGLRGIFPSCLTLWMILIRKNGILLYKVVKKKWWLFEDLACVKVNKSFSTLLQDFSFFVTLPPNQYKITKNYKIYTFWLTLQAPHKICYTLKYFSNILNME